MFLLARPEAGPPLSDQELVIPSWRVTRQRLYQNPGVVTTGQARDRSLPPRVWSAARNQVTFSIVKILFTVINMLQEVIDPEWERIVENHRRDRDATERGRPRGRQDTRSTIWDYKQPQAKSEQEAAAARAEVSAPAEEKCSNTNGVFSFVPATNCAPQPSSPEVIRVDSESRQSRGEGQERRSRLSAFQQIWPQTYNSFQNRAVSVILVFPLVQELRLLFRS